MNRLQLATLLSWAGDSGIQGRKRLQKVVFFLQDAGCALDCQYTLHHFGPYSRDVADACDEMVAAGLVVESGGPQNGDMQYGYKLKPDTRALLDRTPNEPMQRFRELGTSLISENLWSLELGSTILFFFKQNNDWNAALMRACEFKKVSAELNASKTALALAQRVHTQSQR
ncbi:MAG: hypothetical protein QM754_02215 [Tepidisphaeraceae bacterium]